MTRCGLFSGGGPASTDPSPGRRGRLPDPLRRTVRSPQRRSQVLTPRYGSLRFMVRIDASETQCFRASLRIYGSQTLVLLPKGLGRLPYGTLRHFTLHGTDGDSKSPMFPAFLTDL